MERQRTPIYVDRHGRLILAKVKRLCVYIYATRQGTDREVTSVILNPQQDSVAIRVAGQTVENILIEPTGAVFSFAFLFADSTVVFESGENRTDPLPVDLRSNDAEQVDYTFDSLALFQY